MTPGSLIDRSEADANAEPLLFSLPAPLMNDLEEMEQRGEFTAERLFSRDRDRYDAIVALCGMQLSQREIARTLKVSPNTVRRVEFREAQSIDALKKRTLDKLDRFILAASDRLAADVDELDLDKLAISLGIAIEKRQLLGGGATARVEITDGQLPALDALRAYIASLTAKPATAIEVPTPAPALAIGSEGGKGAQKGASAPAGSPAPAAASTSAPAGSPAPAAASTVAPADRQSVAFPAAHSDASLPDTAPATEDHAP